MKVHVGKIGKPLGIPRTPGAHATVYAFNSRQNAINSHAEAMRHLHDLGVAKQVTDKTQEAFEQMVLRFWTSRLVELRTQFGSEDIDLVEKILEEKLGKPSTE